MKKILGVLLLLASSSAFAVNRHIIITALPNATAPAMIVSAQGGNDHTDLILTNPGSTALAFDIDQCMSSPAILGTQVPANGSTYLHDFANYTCTPGHFKLTLAPAGVGLLSVVTIGNSTFEVPPIGAVDKDHTSTIGKYPQHALVNEEAIQDVIDHKWYLGSGSSHNGLPFDTKALAQAHAQNVYLTTFNAGHVVVNVHGPSGTLLETESFYTTDGVNQYKLHTTFTSGWIDVKTEPVGYFPCEPYCDGGRVYGLVTVATSTNALSRTYPF
jgi:hypothetical protein